MQSGHLSGMERTVSKREVVVFSSLNVAECHLIRSLLTRERIESRLKGEFRAGVGGEIPLDDARAEVLVESREEGRALAIIAEAGRVEGPDVDCPGCQEPNPANFELCWSCGDELPAPGPRAID